MNRAIAGKIALIIPRLGSAHDGEVVASARAIGRILQSHGLDWNDFAKNVTARHADSPRKRASNTRDGAPLWAALSPNERWNWIERLCCCSYLTEWEHGFAKSLRRTVGTAPISEKQQTILNQMILRAFNSGVRI